MKLLLKMFVLSALLVASAIQAEELLKVAIVKYQVMEPNIEPYLTRMLVSDKYMRMDDDNDSGDYLIFSLEGGLIESVNHEEQSILVINSQKVSIREPFKLNSKTEKIPLSDDVPAIGGITPQQYQLSVNGKHCQSVVSANGLLNSVVEGWREFRRVLAGEHAATLPYIPADQQSGCDLALNTFSPDWFLEYGLPIQSLEVGGKGLLLVDYKAGAVVSSKLFVVPEGYQRYSASE